MSENQKNVGDRQVETFIKNLSQLDNGERARLKRNAGNSLAESHQVSLLFFQKIAPYGIKPWQEDRYFLLATLYPFDKLQRGKDKPKGDREMENENEETETAVSPTTTLGSSFRKARSDQNKTGLDRRFARLLDADIDQLPFHLRQVIIRLATDWIAIDWTQLTKDILKWHQSSRFVQRKWARDYVANKQKAE